MMEDLLKNGVSLSDVIRAVQNELIRSQTQRQQRGILPLFKTEKLTLEANCVVTRDMSAKGEVKLLTLLPGVDLNADANFSAEKSVIQKITIEFAVVDEDSANHRSPHVPHRDGRYPKPTVVLTPPDEHES